MVFSAGSSLPTTSSEINVTPLIDVLLVLLIIFMVIVPVTPLGLESRTPAPPASAGDGHRPVCVRVLQPSAGKQPVYELDGQRVPRSELDAALRETLSARPERGVYVQGSPQISYRLVAQVVGRAKAAGATVVMLGRIAPTD